MTKRITRTVEPWNQAVVDDTPREETVYWLAITEQEARDLEQFVRQRPRWCTTHEGVCRRIRQLLTAI